MDTRPTALAVLCSGSASSFRWLYGHDPAYGKDYKIVGVLSSAPGVRGTSYAQERGVPTACVDFRAWRRRTHASCGDLQAREEYFTEVLHQVRAWGAEAILLSGFDFLVTDPLYSAYEGRILNVHPAFLHIVGPDGRPKYTGLRGVVARTMAAGDPTGSTVHVIIPETDLGPIVAESAPLPYAVGTDPDEHQERMKDACDGPAYKEALAKLRKHGWPHRSWPN